MALTQEKYNQLIAKWKLEVLKHFLLQYFMSHPDNWLELALKAADEYILKNLPKNQPASSNYEVLVTPSNDSVLSSSADVLPEVTPTITYSSEISKLDPEYLNYKKKLQQESYKLGSEVSHSMNKAGNTIGDVAMTAVDFSPLWWTTMAGRTGAALYNSNYGDAATEVGLGLLAPYAVGKGLKYLGKEAKRLYNTAKKQWNADKRMQAILDKNDALQEFYHELQHLAENGAFETTKRRLTEVSKLDNTLRQYKKLLEPNNLYFDKEFEIPFDKSQKPPYQYYLMHSSSAASTNRPKFIDFSKLLEDDVWRLFLSRIAEKTDVSDIVGREALNPENFNKLKELARKSGINIIKNKEGEWILKFDDVTFSIGDLYTPNTFVTTDYSLPSFRDPDLPPLSGQIKFGGGTNTSYVYLPRLNLNRHKVSKVPTIEKFGTYSDTTPDYLQEFDNSYRLRLKENIEEVKKLLPGFIPFGSSLGVANAGLPHATHDIDGFMSIKDFERWKAKHPNIEGEFTSPETYRIKLYPEAGEAGFIDINILNHDSNGYITGDRGLEIARLFFPEKYSLWVLDPSKPLDIKLDDIIKVLDENATTKSIADVFEIFPESTKSKQLGRPLVYLSSADPVEVQKGLQLFSRSYGATHGFPVNLSELTNVEINKKIIKELGIPVSVEEVASDPRKMKNLLDYWYLLQTVRGRGVSDVKGEDLYSAMFSPWDPNVNKGGAVNGIGRNAISFGNSWVGDIYGYWQIHPNDADIRYALYIDNKIPIELRILDIKRSTGDPTYTFSSDDIKKMLELAKKYNLDLSKDDLRNSESLLDALPVTENGAKFIESLLDELGIYALTRDSDYGSGVYSSITGKTPKDGSVFVRPHDSSPQHIYHRKHRLEKLLSESNDILSEYHDGLIEIRDKISDTRPDITKDIRTYDLDQRIEIPKTEHFARNYIKIKLKRQGKYELYQKKLKSLEDDIQSTKDIIEDLESAKKLYMLKYNDAYKSYLYLYNKGNDLNIRYGNSALRKIFRRKNRIKKAAYAGSGIGSAIIATLPLIQRILLLRLNTDQIKEELANKDQNLTYSPLSGFSYDILEAELERRTEKKSLGGKLNYINLYK